MQLKTIVSLVLATEHLKLYLSDLFYTDTLQLLWVHKARDKKGICRSAINYHYNSLQIFHEDWLFNVSLAKGVQRQKKNCR